jgi:hypothetical protein
MGGVEVVNPAVAQKRSRYKPSGRVDWMRYLPLAVLSLMVAAGLAVVMHLMYEHGAYIIFFVPIFAAMFVMMFVRLAIRVGRCRSPKLAGLTGLIAGVVLYGGYYYVGMLSLIGIANAGRIDLLPRYIDRRIHSDVQHDVGHPEFTPNERKQPDPVMNWLLFALEGGAVLFITALLPYRRAARSYCETCGDWKVQETAIFPAGTGKTIAEWLGRGELANLATMSRFSPGRNKQFTSVAVEMCRSSKAPGGCPVLLAVKDISIGGTMTEFQRFDGSPGKMRVNRVELTATEAVAIAPLFPQLTSRLREISAIGSTSTAPTSGVAPAIPVSRAGLIEVQAVPADEAKKLLNGWSILVANLLAFSIVIVMLASIAGIFGAVWLSGALELGKNGARPDPVRLVLGLFLAVVAFVLAVVSGYVGLKNSSVVGNWYFHSRAKRYFSLRRNKLVNPSQATDLLTFFVEVVPRNNWGKMMAETATDVGFLQIDPRRGEIRFEGDIERYRIPAAAIADCRLEQVAAASADSQIVYFMVVVSGQTASGPWEAPFCVRQTKMIVPARHRQLSGSVLFAAINGIRPDVAAQFDDVDTVVDSPANDVSGAPKPPPVLTKKPGFFSQNGLRLTIVLLAVGFGIWRGLAERHDRTSPTVRNVDDGETEAGAPGPSLPLRLSNIRSSQKLTDAAPYYTAGGTWTVFDCAPMDDPQASVTLAVEAAQGGGIDVDGTHLPMNFAHAAILPGDRGAGTRFVAAIAKALRQESPALSANPQPLKLTKLNTAILGEHLSAPEQGLKSGGGTWVATKWFFEDEGVEAEVYFNYDLTSMRAAFSQKDPDYDSDVLQEFAVAMRDGPRPPRSPANDPNFTLDGPRISDWRDVPNSAGDSASFGRGGKLLVLIHRGKPATVTAVPLDQPDQIIPLAQVDGTVMSADLADADANHVLVCERGGDAKRLLDPSAPRRIWWIDRAAGTKRQLTGPWGEHGMAVGGDATISPDGRYVAIRSWPGTVLDESRDAVVHLVDTTNGKAVEVAMKNVIVRSWRGEGGAMRAVGMIVHRRGGDGGSPLRTLLIDPASGAVADGTPADALDPAVSPDGRLRFAVHEHQSMDITDIGTGQTRTFTFYPDDRRFAEDGNFAWLSPRYIYMETAKPAFIDVTSMKLGYLPTVERDGEPLTPAFSHDFRWALLEGKSGVGVGRVVEP